MNPIMMAAHPSLTTLLKRENQIKRPGARLERQWPQSLKLMSPDSGKELLTSSVCTHTMLWARVHLFSQMSLSQQARRSVSRARGWGTAHVELAGTCPCTRSADTMHTTLEASFQSLNMVQNSIEMSICHLPSFLCCTLSLISWTLTFETGRQGVAPHHTVVTSLDILDVMTTHQTP